MLFGTLVKAWKTIAPTISKWCSDGPLDGHWGDSSNWQAWHRCLTGEKRGFGAHLTMLYRISNNLGAVNPGENLRSPIRRSRHVHDHSFILTSTYTTSHRLSLYPRTIVQGNSKLPHVLTLSVDPARFRASVYGNTHQQLEWFWTHCFGIELLFQLINQLLVFMFWGLFFVSFFFFLFDHTDL